MSDEEFEKQQDTISYGDIGEIQWLVDEARRSRKAEDSLRDAIRVCAARAEADPALTRRLLRMLAASAREKKP